MSRTDKDAPYWVRAMNDPNADIYHGWLCEHSAHGMSRPDMARPCDLDDPENMRHNGCSRSVRDRTRWFNWTGPGPERLHLYYFRPERAAVRDSLRDAARDWNANGDTEVEPPTRQTRNSDWGGGYWD